MLFHVFVFVYISTTNIDCQYSYRKYSYLKNGHSPELTVDNFCFRRQDQDWLGRVLQRRAIRREREKA